MPRTSTRSRKARVRERAGERHDDHRVEPRIEFETTIPGRTPRSGGARVRTASQDQYGAVGGMPRAALSAEVEGGGFRRPTGLRPGVLHGRPSQAITTGAEMAAAEERREVGRLSPMSTDVDIGATWASVVRVAALHRPVQVLLGVTMHLSTLPC